MDGDFKLLETPEYRAPLGATLHTIAAAGGIRLRLMFAKAQVKADEVRGTVVIMNGRGEFLERYYDTMRDLQARGFAVVGFDWRGQGLSQRMLKDRMRGHVTSFRQYDEDLEAVMNFVARECPKPFYAIGHSTGGHILLRNLLGQQLFTKAVLTAPLTDFVYGNWPKSVAFFLSSIALAAGMGSRYIPGHAYGPFLLKDMQDNPLNSDVQRWNRHRRLLEKFPDLGVGGPTYAWFNAAMRSFRQLESGRYQNGMNCPTLIVLAGREKIVDNAATRRFMDATPGIAKVTINTSLHEILMEKDAIRAEFFAAFESFVGEKA